MDRPVDMLQECFDRQEKFMEMLREADRLPEWPVDMTSKPGQRMIRETMHNMNEELFEAGHTLKNRMHRLTDARLIDMDHYREELGDTFAYFMEICILSGFTAGELFEEFKRKNAIVRDRLENGY